ncbi:metallophosphoesterase [Crassaminicella profunda]|uniref:metallophosphoesterase n=1 Tax=Crassaminicella profunda TaxID=1286698 RepID=UPI001CA6CDCF|nr:metallophosphoesterase [Crassaminicella profunda]QZY53747.1 metallophosphoesterase [Crassaminicella profunda]
MGIYVIGDLHLSFGVDKPMDIFGSHWVNHHEKIEKSWLEMIHHDDCVLIPGDTSWAMNMNEARVDLEWIHALPGKKILIRGNHDYWWSSVTKMNKLFEDIKFLQNNYFTYKNYAICGTRGWLCPNDNKFTEHDQKIYEREIHRLKLSINHALKDGYKDLLVMTHYPPTNDKLEPSEFTKIYEEYGVRKVIYGHLHGKESFEGGLQGEKNGIFYYLTSCDALDFKLLKILD